MTGNAVALAVRLPGAVDRLQEHYDREHAKWWGRTFLRPATAPERCYLARIGALSDPNAVPQLQTRVYVSGPLRLRTWKLGRPAEPVDAPRTAAARR